MKAHLILDGTLLPIDRIPAYRPFYSGKHKKHGMNVQVIADPTGRLPWASPALASAIQDVRAVREHGIIDDLAEAGINCWADKSYQAAGGAVSLTEADGRPLPPASRPSTGFRRKSRPWPNRLSPPEVLATST